MNEKKVHYQRVMKIIAKRKDSLRYYWTLSDIIELREIKKMNWLKNNTSVKKLLEILKNANDIFD